MLSSLKFSVRKPVEHVATVYPSLTLTLQPYSKVVVSKGLDVNSRVFKALNKLNVGSIVKGKKVFIKPNVGFSDINTVTDLRVIVSIIEYVK